MKTKKITMLGLLTTIALTIFMIESSLPALAPIPGIKLGLANIVTLFILLRFKVSDAVLVLIIRIILASVFAGQLVSFIYSICGGFLCLLVMALVNKLLDRRFIFLTSVLGAMAHNTGQILAAYFVLRMSGILVYVPFLMISGLVTGLFTGLICHYADKHIPHIDIQDRKIYEKRRQSDGHKRKKR